MPPTPGTPGANAQGAEAQALARQLRWFKFLAGALAAVLILGGGLFFYQRHEGSPVTILVDGKPVATVRTAAAANALITAAETAKIGRAFASEEPIRLQKVQLVRAVPDAAQEPDDAVRAKLSQALTLRVHAFVILVSGRPSVALPTADAATETLRQVKAHWAQMPPPAALAGQPEIVEPVGIEKRIVDTRLTRADPSQAAPYFWTPSPGRRYVVRPGDLGSRIAYRNHLSLGELIAANPHVNLNRLLPGQTLNVQKMPLLLNVRVRKTLTVTEKVHPGAPASVAGLQRVTYLVTYLNGQELRRDAQTVEILQKPETAYSL